MIKVAPSMLAADYTRIGDDIRRMAEAGADVLHFDVMDGVFVPNISFGPDMALAAAPCGLPLDVHLMIVNPHRYFEAFAKSKPQIITIHLEASEDVSRDLATIRGMGIKAGLAISPDTPAEAIKPYIGQFDLALVMTVYPGFGGQKYIPACGQDKVAAVKALLDAAGDTAVIEVDGGINEETGALSVAAGATWLVAGSAMFKAPDAKAFAEALHNL